MWKVETGVTERAVQFSSTSNRNYRQMFRKAVRKVKICFIRDVTVAQSDPLLLKVKVKSNLYL